MRTLVCAWAFCLAIMTAPAALGQPGQSGASGDMRPEPGKAFNVDGSYVEACTCTSACAAELTGATTGCNAMGAFQIDHGSYDGQDLSGCRVAFGVEVDSAHLYVDGKAAQRPALEAFARAAMGGLGTIKSVEPASIEFTRHEDAYTVKVDGGKTLSLSTEPVFGGDHKTPAEFHNTLHPLNPTLYQGRAVAGSFWAGEDRFSIPKGRNCYFNSRMRASGRI